MYAVTFASRIALAILEAKVIKTNNIKKANAFPRLPTAFIYNISC